MSVHWRSYFTYGIHGFIHEVYTFTLQHE